MVIGKDRLTFYIHNITVGDKSFKNIPGLFDVICSKDPTSFIPLEHNFYKQILEMTGIHIDSNWDIKNKSSRTDGE